MIQSDNGREFCNNETDEIARKGPQQNAIAKLKKSYAS